MFSCVNASVNFLQEEGTRDKLRAHERTIGNLMDEIGTLRNEVQYTRKNAQPVQGC